MLDDQARQQQPSLFDVAPDWAAHWQEMPAWEQKDLRPWQTVMVHFRSREDRQHFEALINQRFSDQTRYCWFPAQEKLTGTYTAIATNGHQRAATQHPVYVISKGRWQYPYTINSLDALHIPYRLVIEPQEYTDYANVVDPAKILTLPFHNLGQGSIPARNWVWDHALSLGASHHWILDDNINGFYKLDQNVKQRIQAENPFLPVESFIDRYANIGLAGLNYEFFAKRKDPLPPFYLNTRIYSCILINHALPHRWRGRYNEDTDLSLRALKDGWCTVLFNAYLAKKLPTMSVPGGNTETLYQGNGRLLMAQSLQQQHPDVVTITEKFGRPQHHVNYKPFRRNTLQPKRQEA